MLSEENEKALDAVFAVVGDRHYEVHEKFVVVRYRRAGKPQSRKLYIVKGKIKIPDKQRIVICHKCHKVKQKRKFWCEENFNDAPVCIICREGSKAGRPVEVIKRTLIEDAFSIFRCMTREEKTAFIRKLFFKLREDGHWPL